MRKTLNIGSGLCLILYFVLDVNGHCHPDTQCFGNGNYDQKTQTCECYERARVGKYTGECCESIGCKLNATCKHGYCDTDGIHCKRCQTGWTGSNCENVSSCFPWFPCRYHGSCKQSRSKCDCEPGWVGDLCDRSLCQVPCKYGACPNDPKKCECYENFYGKECERAYCAEGWKCLNGGYCVDEKHCACPPHYTGEQCETITGCSVPCEHGRCSKKPDLCECETNWGPPGKCNVYKGPCLNCSSHGGTCENGPYTCKCKSGYTGLLCSEQRCDGCAHGRCHLDSDGKSCYCDYGWTNEIHVPGFNMFKGPCKIIQFCLTPCHHGSCKEDPYKCQCHPPYVGSECDTIQCPKCCPPQTCDCSNPSEIQCRPKWHHDCCLLKSCFTGDTLVHTARGLVPIETIKEGDMVVTRHENEAPSVTHLRRVDQVRRRNVTEKDLVVFRMHDEDIWVTREHPFFETVTGSWVTAENVTASHSLQTLQGKMVKLQAHLKASELLASSEESTLFTVYDLSIDEYDRYAVGKHGLLVSACDNLTELELRDRTIWDNAMHRIFLSTFKKVDSDDNTGFLVSLIGGVLGFLCLVVLLIVAVWRYRVYKKGSYNVERARLIDNDQKMAAN